MPEVVNNAEVATHGKGDTMDTFLFTSESVGEGHPGTTLSDNRVIYWFLQIEKYIC